MIFKRFSRQIEPEVCYICEQEMLKGEMYEGK